MIKKVGDKYKVYSEKGELFGTYDTKKAAMKRLLQMEYFKNKKKK